jgi:DUF4097 and DUF4098 domain-containing protein YvlB
VRYEVVVPYGVSVYGNVDSGDISLEHVGDSRVTASSGDISVRTDRAETLAAEADSGDITFRTSGVRDLTATADSGDIRLWLRDLHQVVAHSDSGDVEAIVPRGDYRIHVETDSGERDIGVGRDPASQRSMELTTDSGDVRVQPSR